MRIGIDGRPLQKNRTGIGMYVHEILFELNKIDNKNEYYIYSAKEMYLDFKLNDNFKLCQYKGKIGTAWLYFKLPKILK